jgi:hypothetical protein
MKKLLLVLTIILVVTGCMSSNFTLTGATYAPFPENHQVKVVLRDSNENLEYEEIGALQVKQSDMNNLSKAIELAKEEARIRGGDVIFLVSSDSNSTVSGNEFGVFSSENNSFIFVVGRIIN